MGKERMLYSRYKKHFSDCKMVPGSYDKLSKTIIVLMEEGRMKKSGVRGKSFSGYELYFVDENGEIKYCVYRAVSKENAMKQHEKYCKENNWKPCEPPVGKMAKIY